ncbi:unnamed protein product [Parnassius apollo]|uniref:(apollo) hypothetical protein n=1 Tax=Parnassius apollo TaxID=110799 RepID=A0A8S3YI17_PARAO|nr:unnamed protein product [Parnassius apollo]
MDNQQRRRILSRLEKDVHEILSGDNDKNETGMFPYKLSKHDNDSEQECDDDLHQVFSNYDESLEISNEDPGERIYGSSQICVQ